MISLLTPQLVHAGEGKPNVIVILADDLGYSDLGCYGSEIPTPSLDRLAAGGVRLAGFMNGGMCIVSRASLLTGKWWPRALPEFGESEILPELLASRGYRNALIGKWHQEGHPMDHGFHHFFGFLNGFTDHFAGSATYRLDRKPFTSFGDDYYSSDAFTDRAIDFIARESGKPFFVYLSFQAPHNPLQAPAGDIARHRGKYLEGWQATREARFARQKELGIVPEDAELPGYPQNLPAWETLTPAQRDLEDLRMATYAAMVERMDKGIGRLVGALEESGKLENTLILFLSDNGTDPFSVVDKVMVSRGLLPGDPDSNYQPGTGWAYASVTPWRLYKISQHAGGTTTGGIVHWPEGTGTAAGSVSHTRLHMVDLLPSIAEVTGETVPSAGGSFLPVLQEGWKRNATHYFQYMDNRAIRNSRYSLAEVDGSGWELFDTLVDPLETDDIAATNPETVESLSSEWLAWWKRENGSDNYTPKPAKGSQHYINQGDRGSGVPYVPTAMPPALADRYPLP